MYIITISCFESGKEALKLFQP